MSEYNSSMAGKVALITGGRSGIGRELAIGFANVGADICIVDVTDKEGLESTAQKVEKLGRRVIAEMGDVTNQSHMSALIDNIVSEFGGIDVLINNAGIYTQDSLLDFDEKVYDQVMNVNVKGVYICSQIASKVMIENKKGTIINIAATDGMTANPYNWTFCVSKGGVIMLTKLFARELGQHRIRVNAIAPWIVNTPEAQAAGVTGDDADEITKAELKQLPLQQYAETKDIVNAALFLASDYADNITGHTLPVDGGRLVVC